MSFTLSPRKDPLLEQRPVKGFFERFEIRHLCKDLKQLTEAWRPLPLRKPTSSNANTPATAAEIIPHCGLVGMRIEKESEHCRLVRVAEHDHLKKMHEQICDLIIEACGEGIIEEDLMHYKPVEDRSDNTCPKALWKFIEYCDRKMSTEFTQYLVQHKKPAEDDEIVKIVLLIINLERVRHYLESIGKRFLKICKASPDPEDEIRKAVTTKFNETLRGLLNLVTPYFKVHPLDTLTYPIIAKRDHKLLKEFGKAHFQFCSDEICLTREVMGNYLTVSPMHAGPWMKMWEKMVRTPGASDLANMKSRKVECPRCNNMYLQHDLGVVDCCSHYHCIPCLKIISQDENGNV